MRILKVLGGTIPCDGLPVEDKKADHRRFSHAQSTLSCVYPICAPHGAQLRMETGLCVFARASLVQAVVSR